MLFDIVNASIDKIVIHKIGSRAENTENVYSNKCMDLTEDTPVQMLKQYFLVSFSEPMLYTFEGLNSPKDNKIYQYASEIFDNPDLFLEYSRMIAAYLYETSSHPKIKPGEFYLVLFDNISILEQSVRCLGIFKSETKESFLKINPTDVESFSIGYDEGINIKKLDKGCLIFDIDRENGFITSVVDKVNSQDALFWKNDFLGLTERQDNLFYTKNYLNICKEFTTDFFPSKYEVPRTDQMEMLNRSINYFKDNTMFNQENFESEVLASPQAVEAFNEFKEQYAADRDISFDNEFKISPDIVKKQNKAFKSVLKLDKNFHVYIHGGESMVQKGFDEEKRMYFYKLYYEMES